MALMKKIKGVFMKNMKTKLAALVVRNDMKELKKSMDYDEVGGAPVLGCAKPVFKAHGSAKAKTMKNAIRVTIDYVKNDVISCGLKSFTDRFTFPSTIFPDKPTIPSSCRAPLGSSMVNSPSNTLSCSFPSICILL